MYKLASKFNISDNLLVLRIYIVHTSRDGRDRIVVGFTATYAISTYHHITTHVVSSNPTHAKQHYVINFVSDL